MRKRRSMGRLDGREEDLYTYHEKEEEEEERSSS